MRVAKTILLVLVPAIFGFLIGALFPDAISNASDSSLNGMGLIFTLGYYAFLCTKVGYRAQDCLFMLIPLYNVFFMFRISYRVAYLPNRDWS